MAAIFCVRRGDRRGRIDAVDQDLMQGSRGCTWLASTSSEAAEGGASWLIDTPLLAMSKNSASSGRSVHQGSSNRPRCTDTKRPWLAAIT